MHLFNHRHILLFKDLLRTVLLQMSFLLGHGVILILSSFCNHAFLSFHSQRSLGIVFFLKKKNMQRSHAGIRGHFHKCSLTKLLAVRSRLNPWVVMTGPEAMGTNCSPEGSSKCPEMVFHREGDWALPQVACGGCGVSILGNIQKPFGQSPGQQVALPKQRICMRCKHWGFSKHNLSWHTVIIALLIKEGCTKYLSKQIHSHAITCCVDSVTEFEHADFCYKSHRGCWQSKFKENFFTDPQTFGTHVFPQVGNQFSQYLYSFRNGFLPALSVPDWVNLQKWFLLSCR